MEGSKEKKEEEEDEEADSMDTAGKRINNDTKQKECAKTKLTVNTEGEHRHSNVMTEKTSDIPVPEEEIRPTQGESSAQSKSELEETIQPQQESTRRAETCASSTIDIKPEPQREAKKPSLGTGDKAQATTGNKESKPSTATAKKKQEPLEIAKITSIDKLSSELENQVEKRLQHVPSVIPQTTNETSGHDIQDLSKKEQLHLETSVAKIENIGMDNIDGDPPTSKTENLDNKVTQPAPPKDIEITKKLDSKNTKEMSSFVKKHTGEEQLDTISKSEFHKDNVEVQKQDSSKEQPSTSTEVPTLKKLPTKTEEMHTKTKLRQREKGDEAKTITVDKIKREVENTAEGTSGKKKQDPPLQQQVPKQTNTVSGSGLLLQEESDLLKKETLLQSSTAESKVEHTQQKVKEAMPVKPSDGNLTSEPKKKSEASKDLRQRAEKMPVKDAQVMKKGPDKTNIRLEAEKKDGRKSPTNPNIKPIRDTYQKGTKVIKKGSTGEKSIDKTIKSATEKKADVVKGLSQQRPDDTKKIFTKETDRLRKSPTQLKPSEQDKGGVTSGNSLDKTKKDLSPRDTTQKREVSPGIRSEDKVQKTGTKRKSDTAKAVALQKSQSKEPLQRKDSSKVQKSATEKENELVLSSSFSKSRKGEGITMKETSTLKGKGSQEKLNIAIPKSKPERKAATSPHRSKELSQKNTLKQDEKSMPLKSQTEIKIETEEKTKDLEKQKETSNLKDGSSKDIVTIVTGKKEPTESKHADEGITASHGKKEEQTNETKSISETKALKNETLATETKPTTSTANTVNNNNNNNNNNTDTLSAQGTSSKECTKNKQDIQEDKDEMSQKEQTQTQDMNKLEAQNKELSSKLQYGSQKIIPEHSKHQGIILLERKLEEKFQRSYENKMKQRDSIKPGIHKIIIDKHKDSYARNANQKESKHTHILDETIINVIQETIPPNVKVESIKVGSRKTCLECSSEELTIQATLLHELDEEGAPALQPTKQAERTEQPTEDDSTTYGCGIQGRSCPIYFGVKSYLHQFYDTRSPIDDGVEEDDFEYLTHLTKDLKPRCCNMGFWFRAGLWTGINLMLVGLIAFLVGYFTPQRNMVVEYRNELEVLDRWAITYNHRLEICRTVGLIVFCMGGVIMLVTLILSTILHNKCKACSDSNYPHISMIEPFIAIDQVPPQSSSSKIPITEKIKSVQPTIWPDIETVKEGSIVVQMP